MLRRMMLSAVVVLFTIVPENAIAAPITCATDADCSAVPNQKCNVGSNTCVTFAQVTDSNGNCLAEASSIKGVSSATCTANDISVAQVLNVTLDPTNPANPDQINACVLPTNTISVTAEFELTANASSRFNIGLYFANSVLLQQKTCSANNQCGSNSTCVNGFCTPNALGISCKSDSQCSSIFGSTCDVASGLCTKGCAVSTLPASGSAPNNLPGVGNFYNPNADQCGDISSANPLYPYVHFTVPCSAVTASGILQLPYCTSWSESSTTCQGPSDAVIGSPSKCNCNNGSPLLIQLPAGGITIVKNTIGGDANFNFTSDVPGASAFSIPTTNGTNSFSLNALKGLQTYNVTEGDQTLPWEFTSVQCTSSLSDNPSTFSYNGQTATVFLQPKDAVTCTYTNTYVAYIPTVANSPTPTTTIVGTGNLIDGASISGGLNPTGKVTFYLFDPTQTCSATPGSGTYRFSAQIPVNGAGTYNMSAASGFVPDIAGTWQWVAVYSGDSVNGYASSGCGNAPVTVQPSSTTSITTPQTSSTTVVGSNSLVTNATLSGGYNPSGNVTFYLFDPTQTCSATPDLGSYRFSVQVPANGDGAYSVPDGSGFVPDQVGSWQWIAVYSGDTNNNSSNSGCGNQPVTVTASSTSVTMSQTPATDIVGFSNLIDSATLSGGFNPSGTVTMYLFDPTQTCSLTPALGSYRFSFQIPVNGDGTYSIPFGSGFQPDKVGTWQWIAIYSGDAANTGSSSGCGSELVTVTSTLPTVNVSQTTSTSTVGAGELLDSSVISGGFNPTGTVTFYLFDPTQLCSATPMQGSYRFTYQIPVNGNGTYSIPAGSGFIPDMTGTWQWIVVYSGDANNNGSSSGCGNQTVTVTSTLPTVNVSQTTSTSTVGAGELLDSSVISGGFNPTGTVTFYLFDPTQLCSATPMQGSYRFTYQIPVNGNGTYSIPVGSGFIPDMTGVWQWVAVYSGDANNNGSSSGCGGQTVTVTANTSTTLGSQNANSGPVGSGELLDSVTVTDGYNPTGTVTFYLFDPNETCSATPDAGSYRYSYQMTVNGNGTYSIPAGSGFVPDMTGTWQWIVVYSGDANNSGSNSGCGSALVTVTSSTTTTITSQTVVAGVVGSGELVYSLTISGGYNPTGTVTFYLFDPTETCTANPVAGSYRYTYQTAVNGNGTYAIPTGSGFVPDMPGTWQWVAIYSGDANNTSITSGCVSVQVSAPPAKPTAPTTTTPPPPKTGTTGITSGGSGAPSSGAPSSGGGGGCNAVANSEPSNLLGTSLLLGFIMLVVGGLRRRTAQK